MALDLYKHFVYGTLSYSQVDSNWSDIESEVNGLSGRLPLNNYSATTNPTVNDDMTQGYSTGSLWYNRTTDTAFVLTNASSGAANWVERDSISAADLGSAAFADILGTVSQSGGVPTGALIESGSNANGAYFKYADGAVFAFRTVDLVDPAITTSFGDWYRSDVEVYDFPVSFVGGARYISGHLLGSENSALRNRAVFVRLYIGSSNFSNPTWHNVALICPVSLAANSGETTRIVLIAQGRWFT